MIGLAHSKSAVVERCWRAEFPPSIAFRSLHLLIPLKRAPRRVLMKHARWALRENKMGEHTNGLGARHGVAQKGEPRWVHNHGDEADKQEDKKEQHDPDEQSQRCSCCIGACSPALLPPALARRGVTDWRGGWSGRPNSGDLCGNDRVLGSVEVHMVTRTGRGRAHSTKSFA
jgi:hypothetical protein